MSELVIHAVTQQQLQAFVARPSHAVLLHGPPGSGKVVLARWLAAELLESKVSNLDAHPYLQIIDAEKVSSDAVATVRQLEHFLSLRVPTTASINRVIIIANAQALSLQAQNAILKTIEEPPLGTVLILTAPGVARILPTVSSRVQAIAVKRPTLVQLKTYFHAQHHLEAAIDQAFAMSSGLTGLMSSLINESDHQLQPAVLIARQLLQQTMFERLVTVDELSKQRDQIVDVLFILQQMAHARLQVTVGSQFNRWRLILRASYDAAAQLKHNAQPKLVLDTLMLKL